jgi:predicted DNA-binding transcriptional regulator AlpA
MHSPPKKRATARREESSYSSPVPFSGQRYLQAKQVMGLFGYSDRVSFWSTVRRSGIPFIRVNSRRCLFAEADVQAWLKSRTVGEVPAVE